MTLASTALSVRTGASVSTDPQVAAQQLFAALEQPDIKLAIFYCATSHDLPALADALRERFGDTPLIGCTTAGEITPLGYLDGTITGFSLAGDQVDVATLAIPLDPFETARTADAVHAIAHSSGPAGARPAHGFGFLLIDGLAMLEEQVVSCVHQHLGGLDLIGGSAADDTRFENAWLYWEGRFQQRLAVLTVVRTPLPFMTFRTHHFEPTGKRLVVTGANPAQRSVHEIEGRPAVEAYAEAVGIPVESLSTEVFSKHPVMVRVGGQYFVRSIGKLNDDRSLQFYCAIDEGIVLTMARELDLVQNLEETFATVRAAIGDPVLVLGCDCMLRRVATDVSGTRARVGEIFRRHNVIGLATYGEQFNAMHVNQTFTGIAFGAPQ